MPRSPVWRSASDILGRPLTTDEIARLSRHLDLIVKWQKVVRLVGSTDPEWMISQLSLDSLFFLRVLPGGARTVLDLGSGAGFPGVPIAVVRPDLAVTLVESRRKKASFLLEAIRELRLSGATALHERIDLQVPTRRFDAVFARCSGPFDSVSRLARDLSAPGGVAAIAWSPTRPAPPGWVVERLTAGRRGRTLLVHRPVASPAEACSTGNI